MCEADSVDVIIYNYLMLMDIDAALLFSTYWHYQRVDICIFETMRPMPLSSFE